MSCKGLSFKVHERDVFQLNDIDIMRKYEI